MLNFLISLQHALYWNYEFWSDSRTMNINVILLLLLLTENTSCAEEYFWVYELTEVSFTNQYDMDKSQYWYFKKQLFCVKNTKVKDSGWILLQRVIIF
jgi:hypothetical protein